MARKKRARRRGERATPKPPVSTPERGRVEPPEAVLRPPDLRAPGRTPVADPAPVPPALRELELIDPDVPLLLLPVRLETIFDQEESRPVLKIRIYPDDVSMDSLTRGLRPEEARAAAEYWAAPKRRRERLRDGLIERFGPRRASWAAWATRPGADKKAGEVRAEAPVRATPTPRRWAVRGYRDGQAVFTVAGRVIPSGLTLTPDPTAAPWPDAPEGLPLDRNMAWTADYDRALRQGMAITVDLSALPEVAAKGVDVLLAVGVSDDPPDTAAQRLDELFEAHQFTSGLHLAPQGEPTNNTESVESPWSPADDRAGLFERTVEEGGAGTRSDGDGARLAAALGLGKTSALRRAGGAELAEEPAARAMNEVLWPAVWGEYLGVLLAGRETRAMPDRAVRFARSWFVNHVRGGAPLATLRVGRQPYGVLPVCAAVEKETLRTREDVLLDLLRAGRELWLDAAKRTPRLDPNRTDTGAEAGDSPETALAAALAQQPHPVRFLVRRLTDRRDQGPLLGSLTSLVGGYEFLLNALSSSDLYDGFGNIYRLSASSVETIDDQIESFEFLRGFAPTYFAGAAKQEQRRNAIKLVDLILDILRDHRDRQAPLDSFAGLSASGVLGEEIDDPTIYYSQFESDEKARIYARPLVQARAPEESERPAAYLQDLARRALGDETAAPQLPRGAPLLYQLVDAHLQTLPDSDRKGVARALRLLAALPAATLELRLRETLGLGSHRLDAWWTSLARKRLDGLRKKRADGIRLGGYGWALGLAPRRAKSAGQGFVHAPSLQQATTAAILRSGWSAHETERADSPLAVNLDSSRARTARGLLDGVRQGQTLGDLLGARFERLLHDLDLDRHIDPLRRLTLKRQAEPGEPSGPADGLELRDLYVEGGLETLTRDDPALEGALQELDRWLDAAVDGATAESVHQLAQGNEQRAAAMLRAVNTGDTRPPRLHALETPRRGPVIEHRVVALLGTETSTWASTPRARMAPRLESWCAELLGAPERIGCRVRGLRNGTVVEERTVRLSELGLAALDAIWESGLGEAGEWRARAQRSLRPTSPDPDLAVQADLDDAGEAEVSFAEAAQLAAALQGLLSRARPLAPTDLAAPGAAPEATVDVRELRGRTKALVDGFAAWLSRLRRLLTASGSGQALRAQLDEGRFFGGFVGSPTPERELNAEAAAALGDAYAQRGEALLQELRGDLKQAPAEADPAARYRQAAARLLGQDFPVPVRFTLSASDAFAASLAEGGDLLEDPTAPAVWLRRVSRVRPTTGLLCDALDLSSLLDPRGGERLRVAQLPPRPGERWAALWRPPRGAGGRTAFLVVGDAAEGATQMSGLWMDGWTERIPDPDQITGVAFHHDAPSTRAPQALLAAVTPEGMPWSFDLLCSTLLQTIELTELRGVTPAELGAWGQHLPTIYSPRGIAVAPLGEDA